LIQKVDSAIRSIARVASGSFKFLTPQRPPKGELHDESGVAWAPLRFIGGFAFLATSGLTVIISGSLWFLRRLNIKK
jgi:hypothetical protein